MTDSVLRLDINDLAALVEVAGLELAAFTWDVRSGGRLSLDITHDVEPLMRISMAIGGQHAADGEEIPAAWLDTAVTHGAFTTRFEWPSIEIVGELVDPDGGEDPDHAHDLDR